MLKLSHRPSSHVGMFKRQMTQQKVPFTSSGTLQMASVVFPETTERLPQGRRPLQFKSVLAVVYIFGGFAAAISLLSKFIVGPLFEQLSFDRSVYAQEARRHLFGLNQLLATVVSTVPSSRAIRNGYADSQTQTQLFKVTRNRSEECDWSTYKAAFFAAPPIFDTDMENGISNILVRDAEFLRSLAYGGSSGVFTQSFGASVHPKPDAISEVRKEIRSFKGALLAL